MVVLSFIDSILGTSISKQTELLKNIQNCHCIIVSSITMGCLYSYYYLQNAYIMKYNFMVIAGQCLLDLLITDKPDIIFHHIVTISLCLFDLQYVPIISNTGFDINNNRAIMVMTELSTVFLVLGDWLKNHSKLLQSINNTCFISSFFIIRLYMVPVYMLLDSQYIQEINKYSTPYTIVWLCYQTSLCSFMFLNIYWGTLILKKLVKYIRPYLYIFTYSHNEYLLQYTYMFSPFISVYAYMPLTNTYYIIDIIGQSILAVSSMFYHNKLYQILIHSPIDYKIMILNRDLFHYYLDDIVSIHLRAFLCVMVSLLQRPIISLHMTMSILFMILFSHCFTLYHYIQYCIRIISNNGKLNYGDINDDHDFMLIPVLVNIIINMMNSNNYQSSYHNMMSLFMILNVLKIKPFYELNHFLLHLCLLYQTYGLSLCNKDFIS